MAAQNATPLAHGEVTVEEQNQSYRQIIHAGSHRLTADEPVDVGGQDTGPNPYDLLLSALGACTSMTLRMYANHKKIPLTGVKVKLSHSRIHARDCEDCEGKTGMIDVIHRTLTLDGDLSDAQRQRLLEIANRCPVHRTLENEKKIITSLNN